ncbi:MAG: T9SS type A sorting domain-containing protein [Candidatus Cyclobacteriaceae bacterium M2_1C_046]
MAGDIKLYLLAIFLFAPFLLWSQSFEVSKSEIYSKGKIGERIEIPLSIKNLTDEPLSIVVQRSENNIGNGQASFICWEKDCAENTSLHKKINARESANQIIATFEAGLAGGYSTVKYLIFNRHNPQDALEVTIHYTIEEASLNTKIYQSEKINLTEVYPNPVSDNLYITYNMTDPHADIRIGIHNVLGGVVKEYPLEAMETKAKINTSELNAGVYFYSLTVDNETVLIKKFVVRK